MSTPVTPDPRPNRPLQALIKGAIALVLVAAVSAGAAWGVFSYRMQQERQDAGAQVAALRADLTRQQEELATRVALVEQAARDAKILMEQSGQTVTLESRLKEIDTLRTALEQSQSQMEERLKNLEQSIVDRVAQQGKETAQALSLELRWKSLLVKAQGEVLLAQVHWAEGNRGLAKDELQIAARTLQQAMSLAPQPVQTKLKPVLDLAEQAKSALILEQPSARDSLNLLWHQVSELLASQEGQ